MTEASEPEPVEHSASSGESNASALGASNDGGSTATGGVPNGAEPSRSSFALLLLCFFLSGLAALIYQTAWTRTFAFVFGTSELAVATVLAAYMAGLAVGAAVAARLVGRVRRPVLVYGVLEGAIAVSALCVPFALRGADALHAWLFATSGAPPAAGHPVHAIFYLVTAFAVLIVPTGLMGATLPLLAREAIHRQRDVGPRIAILYALNTAGAVIGTLLAGFWLLPALGLSGTVWVAVAANAAVFVAAASVGVRGEAATDAGPDVAASRRGGFAHGWVLPVMLASGAVSFSYEVLWTRLLGQVLGGSVYAFATMLASFLTGIALGSAAATRFSRTTTSAARALFVCQLGIGLLSLGAFFAIDALPVFTRALADGGASRLAADAIASIAVLLPSTVLLGATFPLAVRLYARDETTAAAASARVYAWNTVGAIIGALGAGFFLIPALGFARAISLAIATNALLAAFVAWRAPAPGRQPIGRMAAAAVVALGVLLVPPPTPWTLLRTAPLGLQTSTGALAFDAVGRSATVTVLRRMGAHHLATNGLPEAVIQPPGGRSDVYRVSHWLGAGAALARPEMRDMLVIGLGGGVLLEWVPGFVEDVQVIELEDEVVAANAYMAPHRGFDPLSDPRIHVVVNDARGALTLTDRRFDAIVSQPSHPWTAGASHLYTREFFELVASHLKPEGVFVQWMGLAYIDPALLEVLVATLQDVFPYVTVHQPQPAGVVFFASNAPLDLESSGPTAIDRAPETYAAIGIRDAVDIAAHVAFDPKGARRLAERGEVSTDERNLLQMRSPALVREKRRVLSLDTLGAPTAACDATHPARTPTSQLVRALLRIDHFARAKACAQQIEDPADRALALGAIAARQLDRGAVRRELARAFEANPDAVGHRFAMLEAQRPWRRTPSDEFETIAEGLDAPSQVVVDAWALARAGEWAQIAALDEDLAAIDHPHPATDAARRLQARWRIERGDPAHAADAVALIDRVIPGSPRLREDLLLRARANLGAGQHAATIATLADFAGANRGKNRDVALARVALAVETRVDPSQYAPGERAALRRRLGARPPGAR